MALTFEDKKEIIAIAKRDIAEKGSCNLKKVAVDFAKTNKSKFPYPTDFNDLRGMITEGNEYIYEETPDGKISVFKNPIYKGKLSFKENHPFLYDLSIILITAILTGAISIPVNQYISRQDNRFQYLIDKRQDSALSAINDSLHNLQKRKEDSSK